ncbi:unnamed protein product [Prorocentrum cordatum]|uniref:H(+)-exporting diphosphatase n=1 Tax=Prorocentrum cordatum TaxID=2364126 RepID=A0ABN9XGE1_9DINO|nr:unnamed protein product [Polarella glacialis]
MMTRPRTCAIAVLVTTSCAAALEEAGLGCLRWQGAGGCDAIADRDSCLGSRDGRPWKQWEGYRISGEPCAWCGGVPCVEGGEALCAPRDWAKGVPGAAVANCSAAGAAAPPAGGDAAEEDGDAAAEFEGGGDGFRCSAEYAEASLEFNDYFFTFSAASPGACRAICAREDYCTGAEFVAERLLCRAWWHPIGALEPADGHSCARRPRGAGAGPEAQAKVEAEAAEAAAARQREQEAAEAANATEGGLTPGQAAAIGVGSGLSAAGLIGGLVGGLVGRTTETITTTVALLGNATAADNRSLADVPAVVAHSAWAPAWWHLACLGLLCALVAGVLLVRSKGKASTRSVTLEQEEESPDARAEAGLGNETPLRWPDWARPPYQGTADAPYRSLGRAAPAELAEPSGAPPPACGLGARAAGGPPPPRRLAEPAAAPPPPLRLAEPVEAGLGCLRWQGAGGCDAIADRDSCLGSRDGRPWKQWEGYRISGEPCAWCGGVPCVEGGEALCAPRDWAKGVPGAAVANCSAAGAAAPPAGGDAAEEDGDAAAEFDLVEGGGDGFRCSAEYAEASLEFNDYFFTFSAASPGACRAICAREDYCTGAEFVAERLLCRAWWHPIGALEPADGHSCARRPRGAGAGPEAQAKVEAEAAEAAAARQREQEAAEAAEAEAARRREQEAAEAAAAAARQREQEAAEAAAEAEAANATEGGLTPGEAAAIGVGSGLAAAGLIGGLVGGLVGRTTETITTTVALARGEPTGHPHQGLARPTLTGPGADACPAPSWPGQGGARTGLGLGLRGGVARPGAAVCSCGALPQLGNATAADNRSLADVPAVVAHSAWAPAWWHLACLGLLCALVAGVLLVRSKGKASTRSVTLEQEEESPDARAEAGLGNETPLRWPDWARPPYQGTADAPYRSLGRAAPAELAEPSGAPPPACGLGARAAGGPPPPRRLAEPAAAPPPPLRLAEPVEAGLGCLRWHGAGGCDAIADRDSCLGSRDGRPWKQWEGYRISGEPCAWCGGVPCVEGGEALCAPRDWAKGVPGAAVANCSAAGAAAPPAGGDAAEEDGDAAAEFEGGGDGFRCSAEYAEASLEFNDYFFTFSAASPGACRAICAREDYCTGAEFVAERLLCRAWWHPIGALEPADGHSCARRPRGAGAGPEAQAKVEAEAAEAEAARQREQEAAEAAEAEAARRREQEAADAAAAAARQREQEAAEAAAEAEAANATEGGLTPGQAAAIGVGSGLAAAGLIGGLVGGLVGRTTETITTTVALARGLGNATAADNRSLADVPAVVAHSAWAPAWWHLACLGLLCALVAGVLLVRSKGKASTRSVTLEQEEESPDARAEAGLGNETPLRWPDWARPPYQGTADAPYRSLGRAAPAELAEPSGAPPPACGLGARAAGGPPPPRRLAEPAAAPPPPLRLAEPVEAGLGCLRWQGAGGCDAIADRDSCLGSRDGRPWKQWEGYRISGEPCAWCGGVPCVEGGEALCAPRDWAKGVPGAAVANCSAAGAAAPPAGGDAAEEDGDAAAEFEGGGDGFRCSAEYAEASLEFNDYFFTFSAASPGACRAICAREDYCTGAEFVAERLLCRAWWHPIGALEPADGHSCARRPRGAGAGPEAQAKVEAEAAEAAAARQREQEAAEAAEAEAARRREQEAAEAAAAAARQREQEAAEAAAEAEAANATEGGLTPGEAAAIGVGSGLAAAGLIGGLVGGLVGRTTETITTTVALARGLGNATAADNRSLADVPAVVAHSAWAPAWWHLACLGLLCALVAGVLLVRSKGKASTRSVTLEQEEESPDARAEAGLGNETPLRWPDWARPPYQGTADAPYRSLGRAAPAELAEPSGAPPPACGLGARAAGGPPPPRRLAEPAAAPPPPLRLAEPVAAPPRRPPRSVEPAAARAAGALCARAASGAFGGAGAWRCFQARGET